jgi:hypothetical protein
LPVPSAECPLFARKNTDELATVYKLKSGDGTASSQGKSTRARSFSLPNPNAKLAAVIAEPICLFDMKVFEDLLKEARAHGYNALYMLQVYCLCRISFVKGWRLGGEWLWGIKQEEHFQAGANNIGGRR